MTMGVFFMKPGFAAFCLVGVVALGLRSATPDPATPADPVDSSSEAPSGQEDRLPRPVLVEQAEYPPALIKNGIMEGEAVVSCLVDENGVVMDAKVKSATLPEFGEAARAAVLKWKFDPGIRNGRPAPYKVEAPMVFKIITDERVESLAGRKVFVAIDGPLILAEQLREWPAPKEAYWPAYPEKLRGTGIQGQAVIEFIIDRKGRTVNPKLVKTTHPEFALPAIMAVLKLTYEPVRFKNRNVSVGMRVQYDFSE